MSVNEKMTAIADAIREKTGRTEPLTLDDMAENIPSIYDAGKTDEWSAFWDAFQQNGDRTNYEYAFRRNGWNDNTFKPKYDMVISSWGGTQMFQHCTVTDLKGILDRMGVVLDFKNCISFGYTFQSIQSATLPEIDMSNATDTTTLTFNSAYIQSIEKIISSELTKYKNDTFQGATNLTNVIFEGVIAKSVNFKWSPLTHESLMSIINALMDYSTSGTTYTLTLGTTNLAKLTDNEKAIATEKGWTLA